MKTYQKPSISSITRISSVVPAAAAVGVGGAFALGVAMGLSGDRMTGRPFPRPLKMCIPNENMPCI